MGVYKDMISLYAIAGSIKVHGRAKIRQFLGSILSAVSLEAVAVFLDLILGVTVGMIVTVGFFIIMDWWTGSAASHTKAIIARNKGDMDDEKAQNKSTKITFTIFKFISLYLWVLSHSVYEMAVENGFVTRDRNYRSSIFIL
jgi:hypothetical protein